MKEKHLHAYMDTAIRFSECSTAERLKVGCIAVKDNKIISIGYNGTPNRCSSGVCEEKWNLKGLL
jgi:deoxycytidylate deaminase